MRFAHEYEWAFPSSALQFEVIAQDDDVASISDSSLPGSCCHWPRLGQGRILRRSSLSILHWLHHRTSDSCLQGGKKDACSTGIRLLHNSVNKCILITLCYTCVLVRPVFMVNVFLVTRGRPHAVCQAMAIFAIIWHCACSVHYHDHPVCGLFRKYTGYIYNNQWPYICMYGYICTILQC